MDYDQLLQRHHELLRHEARITEKLRDASGPEIAELEWQLRKVAIESDNVLDLMFTWVESKAIASSDNPERSQSSKTTEITD